MVAHDPSKLPLAKTVKFTEDGVRLELGDGLWATASGLSNYKVLFRRAGGGRKRACSRWYRKMARPSILHVRLKVVDQKITEIETLVARKETTTLSDTDNLTEVRPIFLETVPAAERPSRAEMVSMVGKYFDGIEQGNGDIVPFDKDCIRIENGIQTCPGSRDVAAGRVELRRAAEHEDLHVHSHDQPAKVSDRGRRARAGAGDGAVQSSGHVSKPSKCPVAAR